MEPVVVRLREPWQCVLILGVVLGLRLRRARRGRVGPAVMCALATNRAEHAHPCPLFSHVLVVKSAGAKT